MNVPICTIVIPTKDRPQFVHRAVASALKQTIGDVEVVVVDDGSAPPFVPNSDDHRLSVVRLERSVGVNGARNRGLDLARGEWIAFLDDDDQLTVDFVEASLNAAEASDLPRPVAVLSGIQYVDAKGAPLKDEVILPVSVPRGGHYFLERHRLERPEQSFRTHNTLLIESSVLREAGGWDDQIRAWVHNDLFLRLNRICSFHGLTQVTYLLTKHGGVRRSTSLIDTAKGIELTIEKHADLLARYPEQRTSLIDGAALYYSAAAARRDALRLAAASLKSNPGRLRSWQVLAAAMSGPWLVKRLTGRALGI